MAIEGVQLKVKFPQHLYDALERDATDAGVPIASVVRMAVADWYKNKLQSLSGLKITQAYIDGVVTAQEAANQLTILADREQAGV